MSLVQKQGPHSTAWQHDRQAAAGGIRGHVASEPCYRVLAWLRCLVSGTWIGVCGHPGINVAALPWVFPVRYHEGDDGVAAWLVGTRHGPKVPARELNSILHPLLPPLLLSGRLRRLEAFVAGTPRFDVPGSILLRLGDWNSTLAMDCMRVGNCQSKLLQYSLDMI
jgi:hypothetical protein